MPHDVVQRAAARPDRHEEPAVKFVAVKRRGLDASIPKEALDSLRDSMPGEVSAPLPNVFSIMTVLATATVDPNRPFLYLTFYDGGNGDEARPSIATWILSTIAEIVAEDGQANGPKLGLHLDGGDLRCLTINRSISV